LTLLRVAERTDNTVTTLPPTRGASRSEIHIVNDYPHPPEKVWRALTDPALIPLTFDHTGFSGIGGFMVSRVLRRVRKKMLGVGLPALLDNLDDQR
jgi:hypothetical protein